MALTIPVGARPDPLVVAWCARHLGGPAVAQFFGLRRISSVHGVRLADGRDVVVKVRTAQPRQRACAMVQQALWSAGIPCPRPLAGPHPLVSGGAPVPVDGGEGDPPVDARTLAASAETWEGEGLTWPHPLDGGQFARQLAGIVTAAPDPAGLPTLAPPIHWLWWDHDAAGRTWPPAPSARWDQHRMDDRIPAIVHEAARRSRARLLRADVRALPLVAGHGDFEPQNVRWVGQPGGAWRPVIHDWDSVVAMPEAALAGNSAVTFTPTPAGPVSTPADDDAFLDAYADGRGRPWTATEREVAHAVGTWVNAYNSAFEFLKAGPGPITEGLVEHARERLRLAGA